VLTKKGLAKEDETEQEYMKRGCQLKEVR